MKVEQVDEFLKPNAALDRLLFEYKYYGYLCIGFDFDQTVSPYGKADETYHQVIQLIKDLRANIKCKIVCWTANPNIDYVKKYLADNQIPYDGINCDGIEVVMSAVSQYFQLFWMIGLDLNKFMKTYVGS